jgi:multimeric flavodoxin WrbA
MNTEPIVLIGSARKESDTKKFVERHFGETAYSLIDLLDEEIAHYSYEGKYSPSDNFMKIVAKMIRHETIVFATPAYWYSMSALMKVFFDRLTDLVTLEKQAGKELKGKRVLVIAVGAAPGLPMGFEVPFKLTARYLEMDYAGCTYYSTQEPQK